MGSGVYTFGDRRHRAATDRGLRLDGPDLGGRRRALGASSSRLRSCSELIGLRAARAAGAAARAALEPSLRSFRRSGRSRRIDVGIAAFVLRAADALQLPFVDLMYGDLSPFATKTRFGIAFVAMTLGYALVTALVLLSWMLDAAAAALAGVPRRARVRDRGCRCRATRASSRTRRGSHGLADYLHLSAAIALGRRARGARVRVWPLAPELRRSAFLGFSRLATVLVGRARRSPGTYLSIQRLPAVHDLWSTSYGQVLLVKLAVVSRRAHAGAQSTTSSCGRGSSAATRRVGCAGA